MQLWVFDLLKRYQHEYSARLLLIINVLWDQQETRGQLLGGTKRKTTTALASLNHQCPACL